MSSSDPHTALPFRTPLTTAQQEAAGIRPAWPLAIADRVRFGEVDQLGHVNNAAYMGWFETLRVHYFDLWGLARGAAERPRIVLRRAEIDYLRELHMDEDYVLTCRCIRYRNTSFTLECRLFVGGEARTACHCIVVLLNPDGEGRMALPAPLLQRFQTIDGATAAE